MKAEDTKVTQAMTNQLVMSKIKQDIEAATQEVLFEPMDSVTREFWNSSVETGLKKMKEDGIVEEFTISDPTFDQEGKFSATVSVKLPEATSFITLDIEASRQGATFEDQ